jgi:hypothetical protein
MIFEIGFIFMMIRRFMIMILLSLKRKREMKRRKEKVLSNGDIME